MRFLLYNIRYATGHKNRYHLPLPFAGFFKRTGANMGQIVDFIELINPDIIGLVEVDAGSYRSLSLCQAETIGGQLGYSHIIETKYTDESMAQKIPVLNQQSNALFAKKRIDSHRFHYFNYGMKRLVIEAEISTVTVYLVHLSLKYRHRQNQLEELHQIITENENNPVIVAGDFNTLWGTKELNLFLAATGLISANPNDTPSHPSHSPSRQLDFILHSRDIEVTKFFIPNVQLSDHMPLVCDFSLC